MSYAIKVSKSVGDEPKWMTVAETENVFDDTVWTAESPFEAIATVEGLLDSNSGWAMELHQGSVRDGDFISEREVRRYERATIE